MAGPKDRAASPLPGVDQPIEGPAYPLFVKALALVLTAAVLVGGWEQRAELARLPLSGPTLPFMGAVLLVILLGCYSVVASRTGLGDDAIWHRSLWTRRVAYADITQVKLVHVPGLAWLIVPRLVVRTKGLGVRSFPLGDARLVAAVQALKALGAGR